MSKAEYFVCVKKVRKTLFLAKFKTYARVTKHRLKPGGSPQFLENIVILCFERRYPKQNNVIRLKSNILSPPNFLAPKFLDWLRYCHQVKTLQAL